MFFVLLHLPGAERRASSDLPRLLPGKYSVVSRIEECVTYNLFDLLLFIVITQIIIIIIFLLSNTSRY